MVTAFDRFTQVRWRDVRWAIQPGESPLFGSERGCDEFEQRLLRFDGASDYRSNEADDEVLYVLSGSGRATIDGERADATRGVPIPDDLRGAFDAGHQYCAFVPSG